MTGDKKAFGSRSYEYAVGCIKASSHPPISREKMARLAEADFDSAVRLLTEYGYPQFSYEKGETVFDSIEAEKERTVSFIMEIAPDAELVSAMFFEEDALNLKLCLKAFLGSSAFLLFLFLRCPFRHPRDLCLRDYEAIALAVNVIDLDTGIRLQMLAQLGYIHIH